MTEDELIRRIEEQLAKPQKSERWAMYRLILPIVDFANSTLGMRDYFEFNQTSTHATSQSVDMVLLDGSVPRVMVEAKCLDRRIAAEQISKYLTPGARGLVSNGVDWVLCLNDKSKAVSIRSPINGTVITDALVEVVSFIRGENLAGSGWCAEQTYVGPTVKPEKLWKAAKARRISNPVHTAADTNAMRAGIASLTETTELERLFLETMVLQFEEQGGPPSFLRCEIRSRRVVFFDDRRTTSSKRVARIELGKRLPDILVLTEIAGPGSSLTSISPARPHDKGPHMRRFRLDGESQTRRFGRGLARLLSA